MAGRVIVVGSVNLDLVVSTDHLPAPGETVIGGRFERHHGGKGGNQAVAAARLGASVVFVGAVGDDSFGAEARAALESEGVDGSTLVTVPDEATGVALILVDRLGENCIAVAGGANARLTPVAVRTALDRIALVEGDVVLVGHEIPTETAHEALVRARRLGATTILNPAPPSGLRPETLALADILTPNRTEAAQLAKEAAQLAKHDDELEALAAELVSRLATGGHVLISLGPAGALLVGADGVIAIEAPTVDAIDTVGAGDTLNGALAAGLAAGRGLEEAARRAVVAASLSVTRTGAREGMPGAAALDVALQG